jgi:hypothetical protein
MTDLGLRIAHRAPPTPPSTVLGSTPFGAILRRAVEATPGAIGGAFADSQGEMIDGFTTRDSHEWAVLTAHYGVVLSQLHAAFGTWHFGGPEYFIAQHDLLDIVVHAVAGGYYALLALTEPAPLGHALVSLRAAAHSLHREML